MNNVIKNIVKEEFESVISKKYSEDEIREAIIQKHFIHTKNGLVYSPVSLNNSHVVGVNNDCQHVSLSLEEISFIQTKEDRFKEK
jgi:hypothetical protein